MLHGDGISHVCISETTNEIAFTSLLTNKLFFYTGNCEYIGSVDNQADAPEMKSLCFSNDDEGLSVNVIAVGLSNGHVRLYSTWDLSLLRDICIDATDTIGEIICLSYNRDGKRLFVLDSKSTVYVLQEPANTTVWNNTMLASLNDNE